MISFLSRLRQGGPDSLHSWLIAVGCAILHLFCIGSFASSGVFFKTILESNNVTREDASWPFTLAGAALIYAGPITGYLMTVANVQLVTLVGVIIFVSGSIPCYFNTSIAFLSVFFGVVRGTGMTTATVAIPGIINNLFERHRAAATGVAFSGMSLGAILAPLFYQYILNNNSLENSFLIFGLISLCAFFGVLPMVKSTNDRDKNESENETAECARSNKLNTTKPPERSGLKGMSDPLKNERFNVSGEGSSYMENQVNVGSENSSDVSDSIYQSTDKVSKERWPLLKNIGFVLRSRGFYLTTLTNVAITTLVDIYGLTVVDYAGDKGLHNTQGVYLQTANAIAEMLGTIFLGLLFDKNYIAKTIFVTLTLLTSGTAILIFVFLDHYVWLMLCSIMCGTGQGISFALSGVLCTEYISKENMFFAVTLTRGICGVLFLPRTPLIGLFRDDLGSYDYLFFFLSGLVYLSAITWLLEEFYRRRTAPIDVQGSQELRD